MVYYIGFYADEKNAENRKVYLSAVNKMRYIIEAVEKSEIPQQVISCAATLDKCSHKASLKKHIGNTYLKTFFTFGRKNKVIGLLNGSIIRLQMICYLLKNCKKDDILMVYHSPSYCKEIAFIKKVKKCKLVLEVEEIYGDVSGNMALRKKELSLCKKADAFVFPTDMLNKTVNSKNKPYVTIHGTYQVEQEKRMGFNDNKTHIVYAGTFEPRKGAGTAIETAFFLDDRFHVHILGFGTEKQKKDINELVDEINQKSQATVTYDGLLSGEEYISFIQSCDIGLSPQNPDAAFNSTSFPSKILSYMANGLRVVSINIPAIKNSAVGKYLYYYENQTPEEIANAIMNIDMNDGYDGRKIIADLDDKFMKNIKKLLKEMSND